MSGLVLFIHSRFFLLVDDGTGCVSCCVWRSQNREMDMVEATFGDIVRVVGKITKFREKRQITVSTFRILNLRKC